jgi:hypothetical protein
MGVAGHAAVVRLAGGAVPDPDGAGVCHRVQAGDPYGGIGAGWTLETLRTLGNPNYPAIVWRTSG